MEINRTPMESNSEDNSKYDIIQLLDGYELKRAEALLYKTIMMLKVTKTLINSKRIRQIWFLEINMKKKVEIDGHKHVLVACNDQISIYQRTSLWYVKLLPDQCLYYTLIKNGSIDLRKLTKSNLLNDFRITPYEDVLADFLKCNHARKKNRKTREFEILKVLDGKRISHNQLK